MMISDRLIPSPEYRPDLGELPPVSRPSDASALAFARGPEDLDALLRLALRVFNLELGEGLESSAHGP